MKKLVPFFMLVFFLALSQDLFSQEQQFPVVGTFKVTESEKGLFDKVVTTKNTVTLFNNQEVMKTFILVKNNQNKAYHFERKDEEVKVVETIIVEYKENEGNSITVIVHSGNFQEKFLLNRI